MAILFYAPESAANNLYFNGADTVVSLGSDLPASSIVTMEAWVYRTQASDMTIIDHGSNTTLNYRMHLWVNGEIIVRWYNGGWHTLLNTPGNVPMNEWTYIAGIIKPGLADACKVYLGTSSSDNTGATSMTTNASEILKVGLDRDDNSPAKGYIKNVIVTTDVDVAPSVLLEHAAGNYNNTPGADIFWKLNERQGTTAIDSANSNNGIISNGTWQVVS